MNKVFLMCLVVVGVVALALDVWHPTSSVPTTPAGGQPMLQTKTISIGSRTLVVEVASTTEQKQHGLSGRSGLLPDTGMLFVFDPAVAEGFWMKDMLFSLDIIWADGDGTIVTIDQDLAPSTYPNVFKPSAPAKYVLEVPAGYTVQKGIAVGQKIVVQ